MSLRDLDSTHLLPFRQALTNLLSTHIAEFTYAQLVDGMPTKSVYSDHWYTEEFPVAQHEQLCPGALEKALAFRAAFDIFSLDFEPETINAYQSESPGTVAWKLRLLELLAIACHDIAVYLYQLDSGVHKHAEWTRWRDRRLATVPPDSGIRERSMCGPPSPFYAAPFAYPDGFPGGLADVAGCWAEGQIFGGVVLFDRGPSEMDCNGIYLHKGSIIAPPTEHQFKAMMEFLLLETPDSTLPCPFPITITDENRWRWHAYDGMVQHQIFKYRHEILPKQPGPAGHTLRRPEDWPEVGDYEIAWDERRKKATGQSYSETLYISLMDKIKRTITPTSRYWPEFEEEITRMEPNEVKRGRPPYFFDF